MGKHHHAPVKRYWVIETLIGLEVLWFILYLVGLSLHGIDHGDAATFGDHVLGNEYLFCVLVHLMAAFVLADAREHPLIQLATLIKLAFVVAIEIFLCVNAFNGLSNYVNPLTAIENITAWSMLKAISVFAVILSGLSLIVLSIFYYY